MNCAAIPEELIESELFGFTKGAFTGATDSRIGKFEAANGGTLFLDEICDMSLSTQAKVLRILQEQRFEKLGSTETITVDVRIIAATNIPVEEAIRDGKFREDLYYRLNVIPITIPPLRERTSDIPLLVDYYISKTLEENNLLSKK
ncbi:sigma-54 interaction domain protein [Leptospira interrogans serovar Copenhageni str. LT2050]|nr:sigma-54 interaction domain protein [Leptospira interrogans serovar Copenhageni str. LT2050]